MFQYTGKQKPGRGRNKVYEGNINMQHIDRRRIKCCFNVDDCCVFSDVVYSVSLKRYIRIVYIEEYDNQDLACGYTVLYSTDLKQDPRKIYEYYTCRFQIEFLFRDAKQHISMQEFQIRSENKINFHVNASLTAVSLAKAGTILAVFNTPLISTTGESKFV